MVKMAVKTLTVAVNLRDRDWVVACFTIIKPAIKRPADHEKHSPFFVPALNYCTVYLHNEILVKANVFLYFC